MNYNLQLIFAFCVCIASGSNVVPVLLRSLEQCDVTKGCFNYPRGCRSNCSIFSTFEPLNAGRDIRFEVGAKLTSTSSSQYAVLGLTEDHLGGDAFLVFFNQRSSQVSTHLLGYLYVMPGESESSHYFVATSSNYFANRTCALTDGYFWCGFTVSAKITHSLRSFESPLFPTIASGRADVFNNGTPILHYHEVGSRLTYKSWEMLKPVAYNLATFRKGEGRLSLPGGCVSNCKVFAKYWLLRNGSSVRFEVGAKLEDFSKGQYAALAFSKNGKMPLNYFTNQRCVVVDGFFSCTFEQSIMDEPPLGIPDLLRRPYYLSLASGPVDEDMRFYYHTNGLAADTTAARSFIFID